MGVIKIDGVLAFDTSVRYVSIDVSPYRIDIKVIREKEPGQNILICDPEAIKRFNDKDVEYFKEMEENIYEQIKNAHKAFDTYFLKQTSMPYTMNLVAYRKARKYMEQMEINTERLYDMPYIIWACANQ